MNKAFWQGKKVFITGHTGFKGSWLTLWLKLLGAQVTGYALKPQTSPNLFETSHVSYDIQSIYGDILDMELLLNTIQQEQPDIIFHLAAQPLVRQSYMNPTETYAVNVMGTVNLLEAIRNVNCARVVIVVTSDKCYENQEWVWGYRESEPMGGFDPYSSSKGCTELVVSAFRRSYFNPDSFNKHHVSLATVRAGNVIGGGDWAENRLIPDLIRSFCKKEPCFIRNPVAHRPWQYVLDLLQGYLMLAEQMWHDGATHASAWNFGPNDLNVKPVSWVANELVRLWGDSAEWVQGEDVHLHEAICLKLDSNKSRMLLGWEPKMSISDALKNTFAWYLAHHQQEDMVRFSKRQIEEYENQGSECVC